MKQSLGTSFIFFIIFLFAVNGWAGDNYWTAEKPYGGHIVSIDIDPFNPDILYVYCNESGIFKSSDGGQNWRHISKNIGLKLTYYGDLEIDPVDSDILYFTDEDKVYKSKDGGETWQPAMNGFNASRKIDIDINPFNHQQLIGVGSGVYQSFDGGKQWHYNGFNYVSLYAAEYDALDSNVIYIGMLTDTNWPKSNGFGRSEDNGKSWKTSNTGLENFYVFTDIEIDPLNNHKIYISGEGAYCYPSWYPEALPNFCIFKSENRGDSWTCINHNLKINQARQIKVHPNFNNILFVCADKKGLYKSQNSGLSWETANQNLGSVSAKCMTFDKTNNIIYLGTEFAGLFRSFDDGETWIECNNGLYGLIITGIRFNPQNSQTIYLAKYGQPLKTINGGKTWQRLGKDTLWEINAYELQIDPVDTSIIYLGAMAKISNDHRMKKNGGFFISFNAGESWQKRNSGFEEETDVYCIDVYEKNSQRILYAGTSRGIYISRDLGQNWLAANNGISDPHLFTLTIAVDKSDSNTVYATFPTGMYKTINGGASWFSITSNISGFLFFCHLDPQNSNRIVMTCTTSAPGAKDGGAFYSETGGADWMKFDDGEYISFAFDPKNSNRMLMGGWGIVKYSENGVYHFENLSHGFDQIDHKAVINCFAFHPDSSRKFFCGTTLFGLHSYTRKSLSISNKDSYLKKPSGFRLCQSFPNPFNPKTQIEYEIFEPGQVTLNIYNIGGEKITTLVNETKLPGLYHVVWDGRTVGGNSAVTGVYFAVLQQLHQKQVRKLLLVK